MASAKSTSSFLLQQVDAFYTYMSTIYLEYHKLSVKPTIKVPKIENKDSSATAPNDVVNDVVNNVVNDVVNDVMNKDAKPIEEEIRVQTFIEYFLYKLYYNYGVKRRMVSPDILMLFYAKGLKGYKATDPITMLCRHMMLDTRNMRIISLGIPKAMKLEEFCQRLEINPDDSKTNFSSVDGEPKFMVYRFPEGTMMTYNPSLAKYNVDITELANQDMDNDDTAEDAIDGAKEAKVHATEIEANIQQQFAKQFASQQSAKQMQYSTRKVVGTGRFSSLKTFMEMFNENNSATGVNLELIPTEVIQDKVLVFNIEHVENRGVSATVRNYNTLCAVYQFKSDDICKQQYSVITNMDLVQGVGQDEETRSKVQGLFKELGHEMVVSLDLNEFNKELSELTGCKVKLFLPDSIRSFGNTNGESKTINIIDLTINQLNDIVKNRQKDFQGYIIYGTDGTRTKIMNPKYKELRTLKGNKPIVIEQWNTKNLFYLYWRLMKLQLIHQFIAEFDMTGGWSYNQLFYWFASLAHGYAINLFRVYHNSFVKKSMDKYNIPYSMKPMCGDLHNMYKANKAPISQTMVEQYVFSQSGGKMFWRLFSGK
jgi:hypothetical protein